MPTPSEIYVYDGADAVAEALASRLTAVLADVQARGGTPQVCLTGGRIATKAYERLAADGPGDVDWTHVDLWWGDERFVPAGDGDRNADATLDTLRAPLRLDEAHVHVMAPSDAGMDLDAAAAAYADELGDTIFDVCLLGVGPDGHVASLFPGHPSLETPGSAIAVRNSPKPPPDRISLTLPVIDRSRQVWFVVSGSDKADAVLQGVLGTGPDPVPAALASGVDATVWLVDRDAAAQLPDDVARMEL
ncbi:6-phosphogluconolactonase [Microlunatus flavus]|uniref:6-phosphogluconolactonase n=1 Tax=Microlunatus flavus TaxID=1036181 RepID=A0A1H9H448_9ACTN|nr:6-phosphogluconolactonase [Microlunatus flavus]SEQ57063.1 6-phosphogluconolactonase [Microlunatus flavus]